MPQPCREELVASTVLLRLLEANYEGRRIYTHQLIPAPSRPLSDIDSQLDCGEVLDNPDRGFVEAFVHAGWPSEMVYRALKNVADHQARAYAEDPIQQTIRHRNRSAEMYTDERNKGRGMSF